MASVVSVTVADSMPALAAAAAADCTAPEVEFDAGVAAGTGVAAGPAVVGLAVELEQPAKITAIARTRARFIYSISLFEPSTLIGISVNPVGSVLSHTLLYVTVGRVRSRISLACEEVCYRYQT
jgi:hypothetical protein